MHFSRLLTHDAKLPPKQHGSFQKGIIIAKFEWYLSNCVVSLLPIIYCICIQMIGHIFRGCNCSIGTETLWSKQELERDLWCGQNFMCITWLSKMIGVFAEGLEKWLPSKLFLFDPFWISFWRFIILKLSTHFITALDKVWDDRDAGNKRSTFQKLFVY